MLVAITGTGKSRRVMSRAALDAPGALVVTSTRADLLDLIAGPRGDKGTVWVFDPASVTSWPASMVWDPILGCEDAQIAGERARAFAGGGNAAASEQGNSAFFRSTSIEVLTWLFHAAALGGKRMRDVVEWSLELNANCPALDILRDDSSAEPLGEKRLRSGVTGADDTIASTRQTIQTQLAPVGMRAVLKHVERGGGAPVFDAAAFAKSTDTLVIIADDNAPTNLAALATMLLDNVLSEAKKEAGRKRSQMLDPPMSFVLDEVANVAPLPRFPEMLSDLRGYGCRVVHAHQSVARARERWGQEQAVQLMTNSSLLVMGGSKEPVLLEDLSKLAGQVSVRERSYTSGAKRDSSSTSTSRDRPVLRADEIRKLAKGRALFQESFLAPMVLDLPAWTDRKDADELKHRQGETTDRRLGLSETVAVSTGSSMISTVNRDLTKGVS